MVVFLPAFRTETFRLNTLAPLPSPTSAPDTEVSSLKNTFRPSRSSPLGSVALRLASDVDALLKRPPCSSWISHCGITVWLEAGWVTSSSEAASANVYRRRPLFSSLSMSSLHTQASQCSMRRASQRVAHSLADVNNQTAFEPLRWTSTELNGRIPIQKSMKPPGPAGPGAYHWVKLLCGLLSERRTIRAETPRRGPARLPCHQSADCWSPGCRTRRRASQLPGRRP